jgi:hypothetical protein
MAGMEDMNRTALKTLYVVALSVQCLCVGVLGYYAIFRNGRGWWCLYLLASVAIGFFTRPAHAVLKKRI